MKLILNFTIEKEIFSWVLGYQNSSMLFVYTSERIVIVLFVTPINNQCFFYMLFGLFYSDSQIAMAWKFIDQKNFSKGL